MRRLFDFSPCLNLRIQPDLDKRPGSTSVDGHSENIRARHRWPVYRPHFMKLNPASARLIRGAKSADLTAGCSGRGFRFYTEKELRDWYGGLLGGEWPPCVWNCPVKLAEKASVKVVKRWPRILPHGQIWLHRLDVPLNCQSVNAGSLPRY